MSETKRPMIAVALEIMMNAHRTQLDKGGHPYVFHPLTVASKQTSEDAVIVGLLHDVVEDSSYTLDDLRSLGFSEEIIEAVGLLTHPEGMEYLDYVKRLSSSKLARCVKVADLHMNSDLSRLKEVTEKDLARVEKYKKALAILGETEE